MDWLPMPAPACAPLGGYRPDVPCCAGLVRRCGKLETDGSCAANKGAYGELLICVACGDGKCSAHEDRCSCPEDCKPTTTRPKISYEGFLASPRPGSPTVLTNMVDAGDIPRLAASLQRAYATSDASICATLPEPQPLTFDHEDYTTTSPPRDAWVTYCEALVRRDPAGCSKIGDWWRASTPNLMSECIYFFQELAREGNTSPQFCLDQLGKSFHTRDDVRNCLGEWFAVQFGRRSRAEIEVAAEMGGVTAFELDLMECLEQEAASKNHCLLELAQRTKKAKLCMMIERTLTVPPMNRDECLKALGRTGGP